MFGCKHKWERVSVNYSPSRTNKISCDRIEVTKELFEKYLDTIKKMTLGVTTITLRCQKCGDEKYNEVVGDATIPARTCENGG